MGHKVNPKSFRIGIIQTWPSKWFAKKNFAEYLKQDLLIRKFLQKKLKEAGLDLVEISRGANDMTIDIIAAKPGIIIGRGGQAIEEIKKEIQTRLLNGKVTVKINIKEVDNASLSAAIIVQNIASDLEKRIPFRRVAKQIVDRVMKAGAQGVKIAVGGRLNGAEIARTEVFSNGKIPLHTLRANIDYSRSHAQTTFGKIGIKVWIYKGEVFNNK